MVTFIQQFLTALLPSLYLPPWDVGFELEMLSLKALLLGCLHDIHVCYFFDPLLPQGMEIETLCRTSVVVCLLFMTVGHLRERLHTQRALYTPLYFIACGAQAMLALRTVVSELN